MLWFNEFVAGSSLEDQLKQAVRNQLTMTFFLSEASVSSDWCKHELCVFLETPEAAECLNRRLLPVYLGDPLDLVRKHEILRTRFLHADGDRVNQLGVSLKNTESHNPEFIANEIAVAVYRQAIPSNWREVAIILDQRGNGARKCQPDLPANIMRLEIPVLTFRPSLDDRKPQELIVVYFFPTVAFLKLFIVGLATNAAIFSDWSRS